MPTSPHQSVRFAAFEVDLRCRELRKHGIKIKLQDQPFQLLIALLESPGQVVTREELRTRLWSAETFVDFDVGLNTAVKRLRDALGDTADTPRYVETLPRKGYRFIAPVTPSETLPTATGVAPDGQLSPVPSRVRKLAKLLGPFLLLALAVAGVFWYRSRTVQALTDKDVIVLADFDNRTGEPVFDGTLRQGLSSQLEQSPFLNLLSEQRIAETLSLMKQARDARLTPELTRQVCQRTASAATIEGSISSLGSQYVLGMKAVNCRNGDVLVEDQMTANRKEQVLQVLGQTTRKMREKLGESLASLQKYDTPLENVTTPSLEALHAYSLGLQAHTVRADYPAAILLYKRAISLDPNFAMAYASMGACNANLGQSIRAKEDLRKAYELRERVSEREKFYIVSRYYQGATANLEAARKTYELWAETYPRSSAPPSNLGLIDERLGDHQRALTAFQAALQLNSGSGVNYSNLTRAYLNLNLLEQAKATAQEAQARHLDPPYIRRWLYLVAFLQRDQGGMEREAAALLGRPGYEDSMLNSQSDSAAYAGQFSKARELNGRAISAAEHADKKEVAAEYRARAAVREAMVGNLALAKKQAQAALPVSEARYVEAVATTALALAGDVTQAARLVDDLDKRSPEDTIVQSSLLPTIRAAIALQGGSAAKNASGAIQTLTVAVPYELGAARLYPAYLRGEAFLAAHQGSDAVNEFQKIINHPGVVQNDLIGALAHLQLGRAYMLSGDIIKAKAAYQDFLTLWKDADPDIPILRQAKAEYARPLH